jgi:hypothetical protein
MLHESIEPPGYVPFDEATVGWPEIEPALLEDGRGPVPAFPLGVLPPDWARWVEDTAQSGGAPVDYVAQGVLGAVAALCGAGVLALVTVGWAEPMVLWQALVGWPSSGKSPALAAVRRPLGEIEDELRADDVGRRNRHEERVAQAAVIADLWKEKCAKAIAAGNRPPPRPAEASYDEIFVPFQLVVADATL